VILQGDTVRLAESELAGVVLAINAQDVALVDFGYGPVGYALEALTPLGGSVVIPDDRMLGWETQARQYPQHGQAGIAYYRGDLKDGTWVDCLLARNRRGALVGILNHYPHATHWERVGNVNVWVHPRRRGRGTASALMDEAMRRWNINLSRQHYSVSGLAWIERFIAERGLPPLDRSKFIAADTYPSLR
jgi:GNAT superfamily N-acetyltransferase